MPHTLAYLNGKVISADALSIPVTDAGFVLGTTVAERLRTFNGRLFRLEAHLNRLWRSLEIVGLELNVTSSELSDQAQSLVAHNHRLLQPGDDLGLCIFVTPGDYPTYDPATAPEPRIGMHTDPVPFCQWAQRYEIGQRMVITDVSQVSPRSWPPELKCRSRMHYYLADRQAQLADPDARALLLDGEGCVSEASTANVVAYLEDEGLVSPPREKILPGISIAVLGELAQKLQIPFVYRDLRPHELLGAAELLLCSTSPCLMPVVSLDGRPIGDGVPGGLFGRLISAWSEMVGVDIVAQAARFAAR